MVFNSNKHRVIFIRGDFSVVSDNEVSLKRSPVPRINELVLFGEQYNRVINVIHSPKDKITWVVVEELKVEPSKDDSSE